MAGIGTQNTQHLEKHWYCTAKIEMAYKNRTRPDINSSKFYIYNQTHMTCLSHIMRLFYSSIARHRFRCLLNSSKIETIKFTWICWHRFRCLVIILAWHCCRCLVILLPKIRPTLRWQRCETRIHNTHRNIDHLPQIRAKIRIAKVKVNSLFRKYIFAHQLKIFCCSPDLSKETGSAKRVLLLPAPWIQTKRATCITPDHPKRKSTTKIKM